MLYYAGIGSRKAPKEALLLCRRLSNKLGKEGYTLRSGGADGCDKAFQGSAERFEIYYANGKYLTESRELLRIPKELWEEAQYIASCHHPAWNRLNEFVRSLHTRNVFQLKGLDNTPSSFVVCWTPDGAETSEQTSKATGGTGQSIRIAHTLNIPVYNLNNDKSRQRIRGWIG